MEVPKLKKEILDIYNLVSSLSVQGDAVDLVAMIRFRLRTLHENVDKIDKEGPANENVEV